MSSFFRRSQSQSARGARSAPSAAATASSGDAERGVGVDVANDIGAPLLPNMPSATGVPVANAEVMPWPSAAGEIDPHTLQNVPIVAGGASSADPGVIWNMPQSTFGGRGRRRGGTGANPPPEAPNCVRLDCGGLLLLSVGLGVSESTCTVGGACAWKLYADQTVEMLPAERCKDIALEHGGSITGVAGTTTPLSREHPSLVTSSLDRRLRLWRLSDDGCGLAKFAELAGHTDWVTCCSLADEGWVASGSRDTSLKVWKRNSGGLWTCTGHIPGAHGSSDHIECCVSLKGGSELATGGTDWSVKLWDAERAAETAKLEIGGHNRAIQSLAASSSSSLVVSGGEDCCVIVWDVKSGKAARKLESAHFGTVRALALDQALTPTWLASGGEDGIMNVTDLRTWKTSALLQPVEDERRWEGEKKITPIACAAACPGTDRMAARLAACGADRILRVWDTCTWQMAQELPLPKQMIQSVSSVFLASLSGPETARGSSAFNYGKKM
jgi:hypothetical protein